MKKYYIAPLLTLLLACETSPSLTAPGIKPIEDPKEGGSLTDAGVFDSPYEAGPECLTGADCKSFVCENNKCSAPTFTDGFQNGTETDVDCGGSDAAPKCKVSNNCLDDRDCDTKTCDYHFKCSIDKSCKSYFGGGSCGQFEVGGPNSHESCCKMDRLPSGVLVDRYKTTAGRVRRMIEDTDGDVRGWYDANKSTLLPAAVAQIEPLKDYLPTKLSGPGSAQEQLGSYIYIADKPSKLQGCYVAGNGTHTYWLPDAVNAQYGDIPQGYPQEVLDTKPINCIPVPLAMAFCAWDGKKLQTFEENQEMLTGYTTRFPWGDTPVPGGYGAINGAWVMIGPVDGGKFGYLNGACPTCNDNVVNWSMNYTYPPINPAVPSDYSFYISAPGRFPMDKGIYGHYDVVGDMIEMTGTDAHYTDDKGRSPTYRWNGSASFEGHSLNKQGYAFAIMVKYGKVSLRCSK